MPFAVNRAPHKMPLQRIVMVTGVMSGIGKAQAEAFLDSKDIVVGIDRQYDDEVYQSFLTRYPETFTFIQADLTRALDIEKISQIFIKKYDRLHVLCNTAGQLDAFSSLEETDEQLWNTIIATNITSMFHLTKQMLPYLLKNETSRLINMASIAGLTAGGGGVAYTVSKHGVIGFTKQMAFDYAKQGLVANAIAPGAIDTPMNQADFVGASPLALEIQEQTPNKRWAQPEEVAALTLFLASSAADYIQGAVLPIDGGWMIR